MRNRQFQELLSQTETILKAQLGEDYCGLFSIADRITGFYLKKYYYSNECKYIQSLRHFLLNIDFLGWLSTNYFQRVTEFNFEKALIKIEIEIFQVKKNIFYKWLGGETEKEIKELKLIKNFLTVMYLELLKDYPIFKLSRIDDFKRELGL